MDPSKYMHWTSDNVVDWIISLDPQKYQKYGKVLRKSFNEQG